MHQYFLKTTYSMMPRNLIPDTASGASMEDTVRVLPAFISAVTSDSSQGVLTAEQDAYRYLQAGFGRYATTKKDASGEIPYFDTSTGQLMYGAEASATRMVDIPLGGDMNPCHKDGSGTWVWEPDFKGSLLFDFEHPFLRL